MSIVIISLHRFSFLAVPSPTNSIGLHRIQEEHQQQQQQQQEQPFLQPALNSFSNYQIQSRSSSSSEGVTRDDDDETEMDCDIDHHLPPHHHSEQQLFCQTHYHHSIPTAFYCSTNNPLLAQHLPIPTTTSSAYMP